MHTHVENTGQIRLTQELGQWISRYAADERFSRYLEIGTWNGRGSTCCFYDGFTKRTTPHLLESYETSLERFQEARALWESVPNIKIIRGRVLAHHECPTIEVARSIFPNMNPVWHAEDITNFWKTGLVLPNSPEVVLLDGGEYLTYFEFESLKLMDSIRVFMLDDTCVDKCRVVRAYLDTHPEWRCVAQGNDRNGWAVFEKITSSSEQTPETLALPE